MEAKRDLVLVVEDEEPISNLISDILQSEQYAVEVKNNGLVAIEYLQLTRYLPSLIILDMAMPIMDGLEFLEEKQKMKRTALIPVVVSSASADPEKYLKKPSVVDKLQKPFDINRMITLVKSYTRWPTNGLLVSSYD